MTKDEILKKALDFLYINGTHAYKRYGQEDCTVHTKHVIVDKECKGHQCSCGLDELMEFRKTL